MVSQDRTLLFKWRNHPSIRAISESNDFIPWEQHQRWAPKFCFVFEEDGQSIGIVSVDRLNYWSFYLDPDLPKRTGKGLIMLSLALAELKSSKIQAKVQKANKASIELHKKLGFKKMSENKGIITFSRAIHS